VNTSYIDWDVELSNTRRHIEADPEAKCAFDLLVQKGCAEFLILQNVFLYCGGDPQAVRSIRQEFRRQRARMVAVSKQLLDVADGIDALTSFINSDVDMEIQFTPDTKQMRTYAGTLKRIADTILKDVDNRRKNGRDQHIAFLHQLILRTTGRDHYGEIAAVTDAVARGYNPEIAKSHDAEDTRRLINRSGMLDLTGELSELLTGKKSEPSQS
jgi:hypothetical protein